ncbi:hypothetical protein OSB04_000754 [Centaurea solstitialis]|uniref:Uncharacterized protein n=1 Tax=Centaurea solstitialis TaxID=347529 RepID=A0AA38U927_9ASTR|nr:hypothetical protein OSB04_000754 [Centaurea solstitialis]
MSSIGFSYAQIDAQKERLREKTKKREEKSVQDGEKRNDGIKRGDNKKVHPGCSPSMDILTTMSSIGFSYAQINAQQERLREKTKKREEKSVQDGGKRNDGVKRGGNKKVHPGCSPSMDIAGNTNKS